MIRGQLCAPHLLTIFTGQSDISAFLLLPEVSEARNHSFLKVVPLQANLVGVCHFLQILERSVSYFFQIDFALT